LLPFGDLLHGQIGRRDDLIGMGKKKTVAGHLDRVSVCFTSDQVLPDDCSGGAGIQTRTKRERQVYRFAFQYSRRRFQGLVGDFVDEDVFFDLRKLDDALIHRRSRPMIHTDQGSPSPMTPSPMTPSPMTSSSMMPL
jgi:hypothetical protein